MVIVGLCGRACEKCPFFGDDCDGCLEEMKHSSRYHCKVYECVISRGLETCLECDEFDVCALVREHQALCPLIVLKATRRRFSRETGAWSSAH
ncbi:MAG: DUF3795 domain-containing protein [Methanomassiliicoccales archaeon]|nr:DUF3795 domain-containing protein [Methanomassiliicoccales archaeon]